MIDWLLEHVSGFRDRKSARAYASVLLSNGYIKHVVNMTHFNEKCYYIFEDSIIAERIRIEQQVSRSTLPPCKPFGGGAESTTEVTYMSSPSSPFMTSNQIQKPGNQPRQQANTGNGMVIQIASNPRYVSQPTLPPKLPARNFNNNKGEPTDAPTGPSTTNTTWPISPITVCNQNQSMLAAFCARRDCESPAVTNDYASMIQGEINGGAQFDPSEAPTLKLKENRPALLNTAPVLFPLPNTNAIIPPAPQRSAPMPNLF